MKKEITNKFVVIDWVDSCVQQGWQHDAPTGEPIKCKTVGWLLADTKQGKTVAASLSDAGGYTDPMTIPNGCIKKIRIVKKMKGQGF